MHIRRSGRACLFCVAAVTISAPAWAQVRAGEAAPVVERTPWGHPDFQGVWSNQTPVPLERPDALAGKDTFTPDEAARFERTSIQRIEQALGDDLELSGEIDEVWLETQDGRVAPNRRTSLIVDPADGKVPFSPEGLARWNAMPRPMSRKGADRPQDRDQAERCVTTNGVLAPNPFYNNYHQIVQTPDHLVILTEMMHEARVIPLDGRPHADAGVQSWLGDARGRWDGTTLEVDTTNFNDRRLFQGATAGLRLLERFMPLDRDTLGYRLTVTDPASFTRPWVVENALWRADGDLYEVACHEGNLGLAGILSGARAQER
jgi:hypothetical protein